MIIWGWKGATLTLGRVEQQYCSVCERERDFFYTFTYKYSHLFWIPMFSWSTEYFYHCEICERGWQVDGAELKTQLEGNPKPLIHRFGWIIPVAIGGILVVINV
ncbi:MAG: zinc-ribbon domain-containing protein [Chloroflexi bacterium]|nr:zinc-ribbon domain-containing protein [Chloroflexota bacterium]